MAGSKATRYHLTRIIEATRAEVDGDALNPKENIVLRRAISEARKANIVPSYIQRILQLASQGVTDIEFDEYDVDWQSEAYSTVGGQNSNNSVRLSDDFMNAVCKDDDWNLIRRTDGAVARPCLQLAWITLQTQLGHALTQACNSTRPSMIGTHVRQVVA